MLTDKRKEIIRRFLGVLIVGYDLLLLYPLFLFIRSGGSLEVLGWIALYFFWGSLGALPVVLIVGLFHIRLKPIKDDFDYAFSFSPALVSVLVMGVFMICYFVITQMHWY